MENAIRTWRKNLDINHDYITVEMVAAISGCEPFGFGTIWGPTEPGVSSAAADSTLG